jgi:hypothetical protein
MTSYPLKLITDLVQGASPSVLLQICNPIRTFDLTTTHCRRESASGIITEYKPLPHMNIISIPHARYLETIPHKPPNTTIISVTSPQSELLKTILRVVGSPTTQRRQVAPGAIPFHTQSVTHQGNHAQSFTHQGNHTLSVIHQEYTPSVTHQGNHTPSVTHQEKYTPSVTHQGNQ